MGPPALYIIGGVVIAAGAVIALKEFVYDPYIHPKIQAYLERRNLRRMAHGHLVDAEMYDESRPVTYSSARQAEIELDDVRSGGRLRLRTGTTRPGSADDGTDNVVAMDDPSRSRSRPRFGLQTPTESPSIGPSRAPRRSHQRPTEGVLVDLASASPAHELEHDTTLPTVFSVNTTATPTMTLASSSDPFADEHAESDGSNSPSPSTKAMNRRSIVTLATSHTDTSGTGDGPTSTQRFTTPSLLRTPPGGHARPTAPGPRSHTRSLSPPVHPAGPRPHEDDVDSDDDLVLSFLSALSSGGGSSRHGHGDEDEYQDGDGQLRMPMPQRRTTGPPPLGAITSEHSSDAEVERVALFDVQSLGTGTSSSSRAISPFVFDVDGEGDNEPDVRLTSPSPPRPVVRMGGPAFSLLHHDTTSGSTHTISPLPPHGFPHHPHMYAVPTSPPPNYASRVGSGAHSPAAPPAWPRSPLVAHAPPPRPPSETGSAWTHARSPRSPSPTGTDADFDFGSVAASSRAGSPPALVGASVESDADDADDERGAGRGVRRARRGTGPGARS